MITYSVILLLAGKGERSCLPFNKVYAKIGEKYVYQYSLDKFLADDDCKEVIVVYNDADKAFIQDLNKVVKIKTSLGGITRTRSVRNGLNYVTSEYVFIHDGARPLLSDTMIERCKKALEYYDAVALAHPITDTIRNCNTKKIIDRSQYLAMETPQCIKTNILREALNNDNDYTDDIAAIEGLDINICLVENTEPNIKITYQYDLDIVMSILEKRQYEL